MKKSLREMWRCSREQEERKKHCRAFSDKEIDSSVDRCPKHQASGARTGSTAPFISNVTSSWDNSSFEMSLKENYSQPNYPTFSVVN